MYGNTSAERGQAKRKEDIMGIELQRNSATIYKFPTNGRRSSAREAARPMTVEEFEAERYPVVDFGAGWYHAEAIAEDRRN